MRKLFPIFSLILLLVLSSCGETVTLDESLAEKADLLWEQVQKFDPGPSPAGGAGYVVFFSVSDGTKKASVRHARGDTLGNAWEKAVQEANRLLPEEQECPAWVKVDIVESCEVVTGSQLVQELAQAEDCSYRKGLSFDKNFETALLEEELNGSLIYNYEYDDIDIGYLNAYYEENEREPIKDAPAEFIVFQCRSWFCDEDNSVYELATQGQNKGQRRVEEVDGEFARNLIAGSASYLTAQVKDDGTFVYSYYPQYDADSGSYNIVRHAGTVWSMIQAYSLNPSDTLSSSIRKTLDYLAAQVLYDGSCGYIYDKEDQEIKLGSCGVATLAFVEYQEVFGDDSYQDLCLSLGEGILSLLDMETGSYYHILNQNFERVEETRTVYYDGEATYALCRLYGMTRDWKYLIAAEVAVDYFIDADYIQYRDHWVAYSMNELTKYVSDTDYWDFAMRNALENLETINGMNSSPTNLELLMNAFEIYLRMPTSSAVSQDEKEEFLSEIALQVKKSVGEFFYPEYAMYMENPGYILNTFMMRNAGFRTRIDDVQHSIGGAFLFQKNYDAMIAAGITTITIN